MATFAAADKPAWRRLRPPPAGWGVGVAWLVTLLSALLTGWLWAAPVSKAGCKLTLLSGGVAPPWPTSGDSIHILFTSNGGPYQNYLTLALYGSFRIARRQPGGERLAGFTRILHRTADDELSPVLPTFRATPAHPECDGREAEGRRRWTVQCVYPVADRPMVVRQFMQAAAQQPGLIRGAWVYLIETDFLIARPPVPPGPAEGDAPALGFQFPNIQPELPKHRDMLRQRLYPVGMGLLSEVPHTGPSPIMARPADWLRLVPRWEGIAAQIESDPEIVKALDWVREMYAFSFACAVERLLLALQKPGHSQLIIHPPVQLTLANSSCFHYTFASYIRWAGNKTRVWAFDKRAWTRQSFMEEVPQVPLPPPFREDWIAPGSDDPPLTREGWELLTLLASTFNAGLDEVGGPRWREVLGAEAAAAGGAAATLVTAEGAYAA